MDALHLEIHSAFDALAWVAAGATAFGLSRAALYRHFEPVGGIAAYIRSARHSRAYQEIVAPEFANQRIVPHMGRFVSSVVSFPHVHRSKLL